MGILPPALRGALLFILGFAQGVSFAGAERLQDCSEKTYQEIGSIERELHDSHPLWSSGQRRDARDAILSIRRVPWSLIDLASADQEALVATERKTLDQAHIRSYKELAQQALADHSFEAARQARSNASFWQALLKIDSVASRFASCAKTALKP